MRPSLCFLRRHAPPFGRRLLLADADPHHHRLRARSIVASADRPRPAGAAAGRWIAGHGPRHPAAGRDGRWRPQASAAMRGGVGRPGARVSRTPGSPIRRPIAARDTGAVRSVAGAGLAAPQAGAHHRASARLGAGGVLGRPRADPFGARSLVVVAGRVRAGAARTDRRPRRPCGPSAKYTARGIPFGAGGSAVGVRVGLGVRGAVVPPNDVGSPVAAALGARGRPEAANPRGLHVTVCWPTGAARGGRLAFGSPPGGGASFGFDLEVVP